jgi:hypothetical protein
MHVFWVFNAGLQPNAFLKGGGAEPKIENEHALRGGLSSSRLKFIFPSRGICSQIEGPGFIVTNMRECEPGFLRKSKKRGEKVG